MPSFASAVATIEVPEVATRARREEASTMSSAVPAASGALERSEKATVERLKAIDLAIGQAEKQFGRGAIMRLARDAVVAWPLRGSLGATWTQYRRYARGDAAGGMHGRRHAIRFDTYAFLVAAFATWWSLLLVGVAAGAALYAARPVRRAFARGGPAVLAVAALTPFLLLVTDLAKMVGFLSGLASRPKGAHRP